MTKLMCNYACCMFLGVSWLSSDTLSTHGDVTDLGFPMLDLLDKHYQAAILIPVFALYNDIMGGGDYCHYKFMGVAGKI